MQGKNKEATTLFAGGLNPLTTERNLKNFISRFGEVVSVRMPMKKGQSRCIAFIDIKDRKTAEKIINCLSKKKHFLDQRHITVDFSNKSEEDKLKKQRMRLHMKQIPLNTPNEEIEQFLKSQGYEIRSAYQIKTESGDPKGFGFIDFYNEEDAQSLLKLGYFSFRGIEIQVEPYIPKYEKMKKRVEKSEQSNSKKKDFDQKSYQSKVQSQYNEKKNYKQYGRWNTHNYYGEEHHVNPSRKGSHWFKGWKNNNSTSKGSKFSGNHYQDSTLKKTQRLEYQDSPKKSSNMNKKIPSIDNLMTSNRKSLNFGDSYFENKNSENPSTTGNRLSFEHLVNNLPISPRKSNNIENEEHTRNRIRSENFFEKSNTLRVQTTREPQFSINHPFSEENSPLLKRRKEEFLRNFDLGDDNFISMYPVLDNEGVNFYEFNSHPKEDFKWTSTIREVVKLSRVARNQDFRNLRLNNYPRFSQKTDIYY